MDLSDIKQFLLYDFKSESDIVASVDLIGHNFTKDRAKISKYLSDEKLVSAYSYFYLPTNMPKLDSVFSYLNKSYDDFSDYEIVDIGTGPGTFLLALLDRLPGNRFYGVETSTLMLKQADKLINGFYPNADVSLVSKIKDVPKKSKKRLGLFSHSANEMKVEEVFHYINILDLDEVLFIEPGTKEFFRKSLENRCELIKN